MATEFKKVKGIQSLYRHPKNNIYYERPTIGGKRTWLSLECSTIEAAKVALEERKIKRRREADGFTEDNFKNVAKLPVGKIIDTWILAGMPNSKDNPTIVIPSDVLEIEDAEDRLAAVIKIADDNQHHGGVFARNLRPFFKGREFGSVNQATLNAYRDQRQEKIKTQKKGRRMIDRELMCLTAMFKYSVRLGIIPFNTIADRIKYEESKEIVHCKDRMPESIDEMHDVAAKLFNLGTKETESCAWQYLIEGYTALRTEEALELRAPGHCSLDEPGAATPDGGSYRIHHVKETKYANQCVQVNDGLKAALEAHAIWKKVRFPDSPWMFPGHVTGKPLHVKSLTHLLNKLWKLPDGHPNKTRKHFISHGQRALFGFIRRSQGASDEIVCHEINHVGGLETFRKVYGIAPKHWSTGQPPRNVRIREFVRV